MLLLSAASYFTSLPAGETCIKSSYVELGVVLLKLQSTIITTTATTTTTTTTATSVANATKTVSTQTPCFPKEADNLKQQQKHHHNNHNNNVYDNKVSQSDTYLKKKNCFAVAAAALATAAIFLCCLFNAVDRHRLSTLCLVFLTNQSQIYGSKVTIMLQNSTKNASGKM
uniref:Uncharacterized protein n=1 Tax=Glossina pallidipes TaxID=7398 RepID=A0A1A9ZQ68_GLOPL